MSTAWVLLIVAGLLEIGWAIGLKASQGFTRPIPSALTILALISSLLLLARAMQVLPVGTAYAIWVGIGAMGTAILGMLVYHESVSVLKIFSLLALLVGLVGLKLSNAG
jgi:quaternary ammonium compound-resistance protein SugE